MRAFPLTGIRAMEMRDVPDPRIERPHDVLLRVGVVGVCGSDIHYYHTGRIGELVVDFPFTVGHEGAGVVLETGSAVTRVRPGYRVAIEPAVTCGECDQCRSGRENTCRRNRFLGCPGQLEGALSEYLVMPEENCFPLREGSSLDLGALSEPLAIGVYAVDRSIAMSGARIGVLGMGPIGHSVMLPALLEGAGAVYCTDKIDGRVEKARQNGAAWAGNPLGEDIVGEILEREPLGLDCVFECCGQQEACDQAVELLKPGGKLMMIGIPELERISFIIDKMRRKEICFQNVRRQVGCVQKALNLLESGKISASAFVTHRFGFSQSKEAFDIVGDYRDGVLKAMIDVSDEDTDT